MVGCREHGDEPSTSIKCGDFFLLSEKLLDSQIRLCFMELIQLFRTSQKKTWGCECKDLYGYVV